MKKAIETNLDRDLRAAHEAGMSYCQWKVLHPHTDPNRIPDDGKRHCEYCFNEIPEHMNSRATYCCTKCRDRASTERHRKRELARIYG